MITKIFEIITKTGKAEKDLENFANAADDAADGIEKVNEGLEKTNKESQKTSGLGKAFGVAKKGAKGLAGGFKLIGTALKAAGIGLIIGLFVALKTALEENQKAIDILAVVTETISLVFSAVSTVLKDVYENVASASENFDALGTVMDSILTLVITPFKLGFEGITGAIVQAQLAWEKSYFGDKDPKKIKELQAELKVIQDNVAKIGLEAIAAGEAIIDNAGEAFNEVLDIGKQVIEEVSKINVKAIIETANANVELKKSAELAAVANQGLIEKYDKQAEQQRQIRDDERKSITERKKANNELLVILNKQEKAMLSNAKISLRAARAELKKDKNNIKFKKAVMEAENELAAVRATVAGFKSEQLVNEAALEKEAQELINARLESEANLSIEQKRFNAEQIKNDLERLEKQKEIDAEERKIQTTRLQGIIDAANEGTQARVDAEIAYNESKQELDQQDVLRAKEIADAKVRINKEKNEQKIQNDKDAEAEIDKQRQQNLDAFEQAATMTMNALIAINELTQAFAKEDEESQKKAFKINKAISIANATINTAVGISKAIASSAPPMNFINAAIVAATGIAAVKNIEKTTFDSSSFDTSAPSTSGGASGGANTSPTNAPNFNVVGQSGFNQVASALGQQQPVQAFVVAGDVTTGQQLANNTITQATF